MPVEEVARLRYSPSASVSGLSSLILFLTPLCSRCVLLPATLLFSTLSIRPGFLGSLRRLVRVVGLRLLGRVRPAPLVLLRPRSSLLLPLLLGQSGQGKKKGKGKAPFPLPLEAPAAREVKEKGPGRSQPDGVTLPHEGWGLPVISLEELAGNWSRDLGGDRSSGRLPCPVQGLSSSPSSHTGIVSDVPGRLSSGSSLAARGRGDACQRSLRNRPRSGSRLLQSSLPGGEGDWRLEACDRSLSFERLRPADAVQDGNSRFGAVVCQRGGFSSFLGSEGCVLSDPDPWIIEEAVEVHVGGDSLPVQSPVLRSVDCSPGLYQSLRGGVGLGSRSRCPTAPLPGRLVGPLLLGEEGQGVDQGAPLALSHPRDCDKREEVGSRALAVCEVSRYDHRYRCRQGLPVSSKSREVPCGSREILFNAISPSSALAGDLGSPGFAGAVGSSRSTSDALLAVASEVPVVPRVRPSLASGGFAGGSETGPVLVDGEGSPVSGGSIRDTCSGSTPVFGRVFVGLGCSPPRSKRVRGVVRPGEVVAHQSSRNEGPLPGSSGFSRRCSRSPCDRDVRQLHGCGVRQQTGGHGVEASVFVGQPPSEMDGVFRRPSRSEVSSQASPTSWQMYSAVAGKFVGTEWSLHPQVARALLRTWGNPSIDLFATCLNAKLPLYCSLVPDPQAVFEDAFRHPWDDLDLYAFPPFALVGRVIARIQQSSRVAMTLVAPLWPEKEWFADLLLLLTQPPLVLPCWDRLLRQPHCNLFHQGAHALNLHAWRLSSDTTESRAFRGGLLESCQGSSENLPLACTSRDGRSSVVSVVEGALLQSTPLFL